jgi:hypothetical protein
MDREDTDGFPVYTYLQEESIMTIGTSLICSMYGIRYSRNRSSRVWKKLIKRAA